MENNIPNCFYRISVKALILNESRDKFLIVQEQDGRWELPGGGLDFGAAPQDDLVREIGEEMGIKATYVAPNPSYFLTYYSERKNIWVANILFEAELEHLNFAPSDECVAYEFVSMENLGERTMSPNVRILASMFNPNNHLARQ